VLILHVLLWCRECEEGAAVLGGQEEGSTVPWAAGGPCDTGACTQPANCRHRPCMASSWLMVQKCF